MGTNRLNLRKKSLGQITGLLILMGAASRVLGYVREIVLTTHFGQSAITDAYKAAFLIPDFIYLILVGGAFSTAFIPVLSGYISKDQEDDAWVLSSSILNLVLVLVTVGIGCCFIGAPFIIDYFLGSGFSASTKVLSIYLTRVMLLQSFFMCLSGIAQGICHAHQQFFAPAVGPLLYNISIIAIGILLIPYVGINGFAVGVVLGSFINFIVHVPSLWRVGFKYKPVIELHHPGVQEFFALAWPVVLGLSVIYLNTFVTQHIASKMPEGSTTLLINANRLMQLPIGIFAIAVATAFFPTMATFVSQGNMGDFKKQLSNGINLIFFIMIPASIGLMVICVPLIRVLFLQGLFTEENVRLTAIALFFYAIGIVGYSQQQILNRGFYAIRDTRSAVVINVITIFVNIILSFVLAYFFSFKGLALAYSLSGLISMALLFIFLRQKVGPMGGGTILSSLWRVVVASLVMGIVVYVGIDAYRFYIDISYKSAQIAEVLFAITIGIITYVGMGSILQINEINDCIAMVRRKLKI